jgi:hypothetical protein
MTKVTGYEMELRREPADGPVVEGVLRHLPTGGTAQLSQDDIDAILAEARARSPRSGPADGDQLAEGEVILAVALEHLGIEAEEEAPKGPIIPRLGEAHDGLSEMNGLVVDDPTVEAVGDAYDLLVEFIEASKAMLVVWDGVAHPALAYPEGSPAARLRAAIAKAEGR